MDSPCLLVSLSLLISITHSVVIDNVYLVQLPYQRNIYIVSILAWLYNHSHCWYLLNALVFPTSVSLNYKIYFCYFPKTISFSSPDSFWFIPVPRVSSNFPETLFHKYDSFFSDFLHVSFLL